MKRSQLFIMVTLIMVICLHDQLIWARMLAVFLGSMVSVVYIDIEERAKGVSLK